jgi:hypothetical protein
MFLLFKKKVQTSSGLIQPLTQKDNGSDYIMEQNQPQSSAHLPLAERLRTNGAILVCPAYAFVSCAVTALPFTS